MRKLHPLTAVRDALTYGVQAGSFGFFAGMAGASLVALPVDLVFVLAPLAALAGIGFGLARYAAFAYELGPDALHVTRGVVRRQQREIPLRRIQNVDVEQSVIGRLLGLAVVRFETAGGGETEAVLQLVGSGEADRLRRELRQRKRAATADAGGEGTERERDTAAEAAEGPAMGADGTPQPGEPGAAEAAEAAEPGTTVAADRAEGVGGREPLFALSRRDLLVLSGLTFRWGVIPAVLFVVPVADDLLAGLLQRLLVALLVGGTPDPVLVGQVIAAVGGLLVVSWAVSAAVTFVNYYGFRLARVGDELVYERGLLRRYSGSIPLEKVQTVTVEENVLMRRFGYAALTVETAGYAAGGGGGGSDDGGRVPSAVPLAERPAVEAFIARFEGVDDLGVERPPARARRRFAGRYTLLALGATALAAAVDALVVELGWLWALPLAGVALAPLAAHLKWRHLGHRLGDGHFLARAGFWRRATRVVPYDRLQTVHTERTVFQRRWNLGSVVADTASSGSLLSSAATAHDIARETADDVHDHLRERLRAAVAGRGRE